jgi:hypothetical protein
LMCSEKSYENHGKSIVVNPKIPLILVRTWGGAG